MMEGWKEYKIKEIGKVVTGNTPPRAKPEYYGNHTLFVKPTDIDKKTKYTYKPEECYSELAFDRYKNSLIPKGATCVVTIGSIGEKITKAHCDLFINQAMNAVIPFDNFDKDFVFYLLKQNLGQLKILDSGTASGRENVSKSSFSNIKVKAPKNKDTQYKIAEILSAYDALIENNLKRIKLLEEMTQKTYEEWFVRFKFPSYETAIFDKETGLPEGWKNVKIGEVLSKIKSTTKIKTKEILEKGKIPVIDQSREFIKGYTNNTNAILNYVEPLIVFGDHTRILKLINFSFARGADGTQILLSKEERMPQHLFYFSLKNIDLSNYHYARHFKFLKEEEIIQPTKSLAVKYENIAENNFKNIKTLQTQNQRLKEARDILLPRLMIGMIDVEKIKVKI